jgi:hypothetical protein
MKKRIANLGVIASILLMVQMSCQAAPVAPWPDSPEKQKILKHCAELLLSSVETNEIEWICSKISTNLPASIQLENQASRNGPAVINLVSNECIISKIKALSSRIKFDLSKYADQLIASNINTYISEIGYCATISNPQSSSLYNLWFDKGPIKYFIERSDAGHIVMSAHFYQNGQLKDFRENISKDEEIYFYPDGKLSGYNWTTTNNVEVDVSFDDTGGAKIRGFNLNR